MRKPSGDDIGDMLRVQENWGSTQSTAESLRDARAWVMRNCPPAWLTEILEIVGLDEVTA